MPPPDPDRPGRRRVLHALLALAAGSTTGSAAWGYWYGRHELEIARVEVPVDDLPPALAGLRIGLLTDLHRSETVAREDIDRAVDLVLAERPDLIVLGGDYVTLGDERYLDSAATSVARLRAPAGVYAILGNHDGERDTIEALERRGIDLLRDTRRPLEIRGERVDLIGIRYWTRRLGAIGAIPRRPGAFAILLAHDPRRLHEAAALQIPLVLSGHTHGGQIVLPGLGPIAARKYPVVAGLGRERKTTIYVSRGVGTVYVPVRINCPPDVSILTLAPREVRRASPQAAREPEAGAEAHAPANGRPPGPVRGQAGL
jgi:predicted MPP superfamily phosphohydrolase